MLRIRIRIVLGRRIRICIRVKARSASRCKDGSGFASKLNSEAAAEAKNGATEDHPKAVEAHNGARGGFDIRISYNFDKEQDPDRHQSEKSDPDPRQR